MVQRQHWLKSRVGLYVTKTAAGVGTVVMGYYDCAADVAATNRIAQTYCTLHTH